AASSEFFSTLLEHFDQDSLLRRPCNILAREAVLALLRDTSIPAMPPGRTFRILELGGGTGGIASYIIPKLPPESVEYVFTDVSTLSLAKAEERFNTYPYVRCRPLDIENDPAGQDFEAHSFHLIIAGDVLHESSDVRQSLTHVKRLLASGGTLLLIETVKDRRFDHLVLGLARGRRRGSDTELHPS